MWSHCIRIAEKHHEWRFLEIARTVWMEVVPNRVSRVHPMLKEKAIWVLLTREN